MGTCHAAGRPRCKWSGQTKHGAANGSSGPCMVPPLPQLVPPSNMAFLPAILLWQHCINITGDSYRPSMGWNQSI